MRTDHPEWQNQGEVSWRGQKVTKMQNRRAADINRVCLAYYDALSGLLQGGEAIMEKGTWTVRRIP